MEVMCVVAIFGIIASLSFAGVTRWMHHASTAEATLSLGVIENGSRVQFQRETDATGSGRGPFVHTFCPSSPSPAPAAVPAGKRERVAPETWAEPTWACLRFAQTDPQRYSYDYASSGTNTDARYEAVARGDLNGDGVPSLFVLIGVGGSGGESRREHLTVVNEDQ